ncbi:YcxB family protein [Glaciecola sp. SC05]|uniref:YcxB family protein n=1 Tax=Glaciecola sp. SC05 TaxID=1987355 RepID=UPI003527EF5C
MTTPFHYSTTYVLDKSHFSETFDESVTTNNPKTAYLKSIGLALFGIALLLLTELSGYAAWFVIVLGIVEALSVYFKKPWWLARQMISRAANETLTLTIDNEGVSSSSDSVESKILWEDVTQVEGTAQGWMLHHANGRNYLSKRCLSDAANDFLRQKASLESKTL